MQALPSEILGQSTLAPSQTEYPANSLAAALYGEASQSVVKITSHRDPAVYGTNADTVLGSGFFVTPNGEIATDLHVVEGAQSINVQFGGRTYDAQVLNTDPADDLALLQINAPGERFTPLPLASANTTESTNQLDAAFGYPAGTEYVQNALYFSPGSYSSSRPLSSILSDLNGGLMPGENPNRTLLESSMKAEGGNSGGPLLNDRGQVIGVMDISDTVSHTDSTPVSALASFIQRTNSQADGNTNLAAMWNGNQPLYSQSSQSSMQFPFLAQSNTNEVGSAIGSQIISSGALANMQNILGV